VSSEEISPKPEKAHSRRQDWVTSFDRDLIRAATKHLSISFETIEDEQEIRDVLVIQVDRDFIKIRQDGTDIWFNKSHICKVVISHDE